MSGAGRAYRPDEPFGNGPRTSRVRFRDDDPAGLWEAGEQADDLGWESVLPPDDPEFVPIRLLRLRGEVIALTNPFDRGLVERVREGAE